MLLVVLFLLLVLLQLLQLRCVLRHAVLCRRCCAGVWRCIGSGSALELRWLSVLHAVRQHA
jgi:hypothetical protein